MFARENTRITEIFSTPLRRITSSEVARRLGVHRQSAGRWRKEWEQGGDKALASKGRIMIGRLPACAPELNPAEYIRAHLKEHEIANLLVKEA